MRKERGLRKEKEMFQRPKAGYQLLVFEEELEEGPVGVRIRVLEESIKPAMYNALAASTYMGDENISHLSSSIASSSSVDFVEGRTLIPHSLMTLRYFPARRILCFHPSRSGGTHAPPGKRPPSVLRGGIPACARFDDNVEPSLS